MDFEPYIETVSGKKFYFLNPDPDAIDINDIAHALSMNCRYVGHCFKFYSVAEHSVHVSTLLKGTAYELAGLLHDASEAYITDIAKPIKNYLPDYRKLEDVIMKAIFSKFGLVYPEAPTVKYCDMVMLSTEAYHLLPSKGTEWVWTERPALSAGIKPLCLEPSRAKKLFLQRFEELMVVNAT